MPASIPIRIARRAACAVSLAQLLACYTYHPSGTPEQQQPGDRMHQARLTFRNGTQVALHDVGVRSDSVIGYAGNLRERRAVPAADVAYLERQVVSSRRTSAFVVATALAAYVAHAVITREPKAVPAAIAR